MSLTPRSILSAAVALACWAYLPGGLLPVAAQSPGDVSGGNGDQACLTNAHGAHLHERPFWNMEAYSYRSASVIVQGFAAQAQNGEAIEMTVWNHHFAEMEDASGVKRQQLQPSGLAFLHRAARRYSQRPDFVILVQTARDMEFTGDQLGTYAAAVDEIDAQRVAAVKGYLAQVLRRPDARVFIHDPAPVGMPSEEMTLAYLNMIHFGPKGVLVQVNNDIIAAGEGQRNTESATSSRAGSGPPENTANATGASNSGSSSTSKGSSSKGKKS